MAYPWSAGEVVTANDLNAAIAAASTGGSPGGSDGQIQYNNGGAFGGASALYYDDGNSRVGIGTTSPNETLDVQGSIGFSTGGGRTAGSLFSDSNWGLITTAAQPSPAIAEFAWFNADDTERMRIDTSGNVGINDTTPSYKLDVNGDGRFVNNLYVTGTSTMLEVEHSSDSGLAEIRAQGTSQGTGALFAGQSNTYGGGIFYNGDGTPAYATGESADRVSFFRRNAGSNEVVFSYPYNSNTVDFRGGVYIEGTTTLGSGSQLRVQGGSGSSAGVHKIYADYKYRLAFVPESYTSYGISVGEYYSRPTVCSWTTSEPLYLVGGGSVQIGLHTNNRIGYFNTSGLYLEQGWLRTYGQTGWYSETYGGGWYMIDASWVRAYQNKAIYTGDTIECGYQFRNFRALSGTNGSWNYTQSQIRLDTNGGAATSLSGHPHGGYANMFVWSIGAQTIYCRNWNNTGWCNIQAVIYNASTRKVKRNITPLRPKSLSAGANPTVLGDTLKRINLVEYELNEDNDGASRIPDNWEIKEVDSEGVERWVSNERRQRAYERLNALKEKRGEEPYRRRHRCGIDCEHTDENLCHVARNARMRMPGFIAEEAVEHIPGVIALDEDGEATSVNLLALSGFLMGVLQETVERLDALESRTTNSSLEES